MNKVKNVIKGYTSKFDIEEITFFEGDRVLYSGSYQEFDKMHYNIDKELWTLRRNILDSDCGKCLKFNNRKLFVFIG